MENAFAAEAGKSLFCVEVEKVALHKTFTGTKTENLSPT